ncbi:MAG TPA: hypothetical protein VMF67_11490 [Rhizomicrobium sp.]|nr:hypothetical protein [Rhizomicrobium sp.]
MAGLIGALMGVMFAMEFGVRPRSYDPDLTPFDLERLRLKFDVPGLQLHVAGFKQGCLFAHEPLQQPFWLDALFDLQ